MSMNYCKVFYGGDLRYEIRFVYGWVERDIIIVVVIDGYCLIGDFILVL